MGSNIETDTVPACVGIIMDGNRRWAKQRGLPTVEGHRNGAKILEDVVVWAQEVGIKTTIVYAFSTENWKRTTEEVGALMRLAHVFLDQKLDTLDKHNIRVRFIGTQDDLEPALLKKIANAEKRTASNTTHTLVIAFSYGGRAEIVQAVAKIADEVKGGKDMTITEDMIAQHLWTHDIANPDLIIRTGGRNRLSNFLPWQSVYSEIYFTDTLWPDFTKEELVRAVKVFSDSQRNFGK